jgi:hypothetical protein
MSTSTVHIHRTPMKMIGNESTTTVGREQVEVNQGALIGRVLAQYAAKLTGACYTQRPSDFMKALQNGYEIDAFDSIFQTPAEFGRRPYRSTSTRRLTSTSLCNLCSHLQSHLPSQLTLPRTSMCLRVQGRHQRRSKRRRRIQRRCRYVFSIRTSLRLCSCAFLHCSSLCLYSALYAAVHSKYRQILTHLCRSHAGRSRTKWGALMYKEYEGPSWTKMHNPRISRPGVSK